MLNFNYQNKTRIIFGKDTQKEIGKHVKKYTSKVLLHYGGGSIKKSGIYDDVVNSLKAEGIEIVELSGVKPNPRLELVHRGIEICRKNNIDFILAVGGGSVIDSSKAIAMGVPYDGNVWDFFATGKQPESALNVASILTLPAAGSESSPNVVITNEPAQLKIGYESEVLRPVFSIVNPEIYFTLPENQLANGVCDMMSHIMERYFTNTLHTDLIDGLSESTLRTIMDNARILNKNIKDYDAWSQVSLAGGIAHNGLLGIGREEDWACHGMEHELSAIYDIPHGAGLAILTPAWMRYVYKTNINMFMQFAVNVMGVDAPIREPEAIVIEGISRLQAFFTEMGLPTKLSQLNINSDNFEKMAKKATGIASGVEKPIGGMKKLTWKDIAAIYKIAM